LRARRKVPAYALRGYRLRWVVYGNGGIPLERREIPLPDIGPGGAVEVPLDIREKDMRRLRVDLVRPAGFSAATAFD
jgi:hypothetical protein